MKSLSKFFQNIKRSKVIRNISLNFVYKILGYIVSYVSIPVFLNFLGDDLYGIWITILSVISWFTIFDVGLGNGLRNNLSESFSEKNYSKAKSLIITNYLLNSLMCLLFFVVIFFVVNSLDFIKLFSTDLLSNDQLQNVFLLCSFLFLTNLVLKNINQLYYATEEPSYNGLNILIFQLLALGVVVIISIFVSKNLILMVIIYNLSLIFSNLYFTFLFFKKHPYLRPKFSDFNSVYCKPLLNLGFKFFLIQISGIILFSTDNLIVSYLFGPKYVTEYSLIRKYYMILTSVHSGIILNSLWSSYTIAYNNGNTLWIKKVYKKNLLLLIPLLILFIFMFFFQKTFFGIWLGSNNVAVDGNLNLLWCVYSFAYAVNGVNVILLNGLNILKTQLILAVITAVINIPLSLFLGSIFASSGVILATLICLLPGIIIFPVIIYNIMKRWK